MLHHSVDSLSSPASQNVNLIFEAQCRGHNYPVWDVAANPHGTYFASAGADRVSRVWSVERNHCVRVLAGDFQMIPYEFNQKMYLLTSAGT